jgi:uncharacterized protein involved in exopolysaccharide biosynthesis
MDEGLDKSNPPSTSYRETFRRHRKLFCMPIILGALGAAFFLFGTAKTYKSTANLWVDSIPTQPSSIADTGAAPMAEPPAAAEQALLTELLTTKAFAASVAHNSLLGKDVSGANALGLLWSGPVAANAVGGQVLQVSYSASSPAIAESVLGAVIAQLRTYTNRITAQHDQAAVAYETQQVNLAEAALATARRNVTAYQVGHPGVTQTDPKYATLVQAENNASKLLAGANTALSQAAGTGNAGAWSVQVIDPPSPASTTPMRKSKMAEVILGGVLGGVLVSFLAIVALTPAKKEAWEDELPIGGPFGPDVPPADPFRAGSPRVPTAAERPARATAAVGGRRLALRDRRFAVDLDGARGKGAGDDDGRFQFLTPSAPTEEQ